MLAATTTIKRGVMRHIAICAALVFVGGCVSAPIQLTTGAEKVRVAKSDPPHDYAEVGHLTGSDGAGCGAFGSRGTYEGAVNSLKNQAHAIGADFVQIFTITEPHFRPGCFDNVYTISGSAYKKSASANPNPTKPANSTNSSIVEKMAALKELRDRGLITDDEFNSQRKKLLENSLSN